MSSVAWPQQMNMATLVVTGVKCERFRAYKQYNENSACRKSPHCTVVRSMLFHSYDYIALFVSFFDIPVGFGSLFQRIASINDRLYLSRLNQLFEEN